MSAKCRWNPAASVRANARALLPPVLAAYMASGRTVATGAAAPADLHLFRIQGKRLRYMLEIFHSEYDEGADRLLELLRGAQTRLGEFNDCAMMIEMLKGLHGEAEHKQKTAQYLHQRSASLRADFENYWKTEMDAPGAEDHWSQYLARPLARRRS